MFEITVIGVDPGMAESLLEDLKRTWEAGDATGAAKLYLEGAIHQDGVGGQGTLLEGRAAIRKAIEEMFAVRDPRFSVTAKFSDGARGFAEWTFSWTDSDDGTRRKICGASLFEFRGGLVSRETSYYDPLPSPT